MSMRTKVAAAVMATILASSAATTSATSTTTVGGRGPGRCHRNRDRMCGVGGPGRIVYRDHRRARRGYMDRRRNGMRRRWNRGRSG